MDTFKVGDKVMMVGGLEGFVDEGVCTVAEVHDSSQMSEFHPQDLVLRDQNGNIITKLDMPYDPAKRNGFFYRKVEEA